MGPLAGIGDTIGWSNDSLQSLVQFAEVWVCKGNPLGISYGLPFAFLAVRILESRMGI